MALIRLCGAQESRLWVEGEKTHEVVGGDVGGVRGVGGDQVGWIWSKTRSLKYIYIKGERFLGGDPNCFFLKKIN